MLRYLLGFFKTIPKFSQHFSTRTSSVPRRSPIQVLTRPKTWHFCPCGYLRIHACGYGLFGTFGMWIHTFQTLETCASGILAKLDILAHADICGYMRIRTFWNIWHVDTHFSNLRNMWKWNFLKIWHFGPCGYLRIHADTDFLEHVACGYTLIKP